MSDREEGSGSGSVRAENRADEETQELQQQQQQQQQESDLLDSRSHRRRQIDRFEVEDVDEEILELAVGSDGRLRDDDLLAFVSVYFPDEFMSLNAYHVSHSTNPELNRAGSRVVWVENSQTGKMIPVARRITDISDNSNNNRSSSRGDIEAAAQDGEDLADAAETEAATSAVNSLLIPPPPPLSAVDNISSSSSSSGGRGNGAAGDGFSKLEEEIAPIVSYNNLIMVGRAVFLVFQGLLAGFAFTALYAEQAAGDSDSQFLLFYQPNAQEYRRFLYILATVSLIGSVDLCLTIRASRSSSINNNQQQLNQFSMNSGSYGAASALLAFAVAAIYAVAFLATLLMAPMDTRIFVKNGFEVNDDSGDWTQDALSDSSFSDGLELWRGLDIVRLICAVAGWIGSCVFVWKDLTQLNAKTADLYRLRESALAWSARARELEGRGGIDKLSAPALRKLIAVMRVGMDRAKNALSFYEGGDH